MERRRVFPDCTRVTLAERIGRALAATNSGDLVLLAGDINPSEPVMTPATAAAVLIAITDRVVPGLILTQRPSTMRRHAGQIAFPGGRVDPEDRDVIAAALREAEEEIALPRNQVEVVATGDIYLTVTGFAVTPVIGVIPPNLELVASEAEVDEVFEIPLSFVLDPINQRQASRVYSGHKRRYYEIQWEDRRIWGATAAMIVNLSRRLKWPS